MCLGVWTHIRCCLEPLMTVGRFSSYSIEFAVFHLDQLAIIRIIEFDGHQPALVLPTETIEERQPVLRRNLVRPDVGATLIREVRPGPLEFATGGRLPALVATR